MSADASRDAGLPAWVAAIHAASRALGVFSAALIALSVGVICHMVFVRAVLNQSSIWQTEFVTFCLIAATFLGAPYILLTRGHVNVDVVPLMARPGLRRALHLGGGTIALVFCGALLYAAVPWWHEAYASGLTTPSIWRVRLWIPYLAVPVGTALLCLQLLAELWLVATRRAHPFGLAPDERL
ncbi:MAG: TRAP transporter small permease [Rubrivivax sp.]|nr:TRAP transporter small permease [Rubrivivax sp.]